MTVEEDIRDLKNHVSRIEDRLNHISQDIATLKGSQQTMTQILKYVVTPLILILGALIGLKLTVP